MILSPLILILLSAGSIHIDDIQNEIFDHAVQWLNDNGHSYFDLPIDVKKSYGLASARLSQAKVQIPTEDEIKLKGDLVHDNATDVVNFSTKVTVSNIKVQLLMKATAMRERLVHADISNITTSLSINIDMRNETMELESLEVGISGLNIRYTGGSNSVNWLLRKVTRLFNSKLKGIIKKELKNAITDIIVQASDKLFPKHESKLPALSGCNPQHDEVGVDAAAAL